MQNVFNVTDHKNLIDSALKAVNQNGLLIVYEDLNQSKEQFEYLENLGTVKMYSSIVASEIHKHVEISHYSTIQEQKLREENTERDKVFRVIQK